MELTLRPGRLEIIERQDPVHEWRVARLAGEQLLEVGGGERVVRGLGELRFTGLRLERADVADVAGQMWSPIQARGCWSYPSDGRRPVSGATCSAVGTS
jgi:hypothetical protein